MGEDMAGEKEYAYITKPLFQVVEIIKKQQR